MHNYLADTTLLIESFRSNAAAKEFLLSHTPSISDITTAELLQGTRNKKEVAAALKTCASLPKISINPVISQKAIQLIVQYHLSHGLAILDALIAATAIESNLKLVTDNIRDFRFIQKLHVISHQEAFATI